MENDVAGNICKAYRCCHARHLTFVDRPSQASNQLQRNLSFFWGRPAALHPARFSRVCSRIFHSDLQSSLCDVQSARWHSVLQYVAFMHRALGHDWQILLATSLTECHSAWGERDTSACMRRHQASALPPVPFSSRNEDIK